MNLENIIHNKHRPVPPSRGIEPGMLYHGIIFLFLFLCTIPPKLHSQDTYTEDSIHFAQIFRQNAQLYYQTYVDSAIKGFREMAWQARESNQFFWEARAYQGMGLSFSRLELHAEAMKYIFKALQYYEANNMEIYLGKVYDNVGEIYFRLGEYSTSLEYYEKSLEIALAQEVWFDIAASYNNISQVYEKMEDISRTKSNLLKVESALKKARDTTSYGILYTNLSEVYVDDKKYDSAWYYLNLTNRFLATYQIGGNYDEIYSVWGLLKMRLGEYDSAEYYFLKGIEYARKNNRAELESSIYINMVELFQQTEAYEKALKYQERYSAISDSIASLQAVEQLNGLTVQFETLRKEQQINQQQLRISRQRNRQLILWGILGLIFLSALIGLLLFIDRQRKAQTKLMIQQAEAESLRETDRLKSHFFANISHEFRTPLTLILGPLNKLLSDTFEGDPQTSFRLMFRNAERLLQLINQLLDLSRLEAGKMNLNLNNSDIMAFFRVLAGNFESYAESKNIRFHVQYSHTQFFTTFDKDKLEQTINNLLSNAFKFTPEEGDVWLNVEKIEDMLEVTVRDNGIGIPEKQLEHIFDRFYQVESKPFEGAGIGLALAREIIELHKGTLQVSSEPGKGSVFVVRIPIIKDEAIPQVSPLAPEKIIEKAETIELVKPALPPSQAIVLLVEDNEDIRNYLKTILGPYYQILEASNGKEGCKLAQEHIPELIISDVMMPEMDGFTFAESIKTDEKTSHIPMIILTAKASKDDKLHGLKLGVDDFLTKPFDEDELLARVKNLIDQRQRLSQKLEKAIIRLSPDEIEVESADKQFLKRVIDVIETYMADEHFSIVDLGRETGLSRSQLHRKLKGLTNQSPSIFLRTIRLKRARQLLYEKAGTAAEISYRVGFSSPAYFTKCYKEQFGVTPGEVLNRQVENDEKT